MFIAVLILPFITGLIHAAPTEHKSTALTKPTYVVVQLAAPKFLSDATWKGREEFAEIVLDHTLTIEEIGEKLNEWAKSQGPQVQENYEKAVEEVKAAIKQSRERLEKSPLSDAAKEAFAGIGKIFADKNQTMVQAYDKVKDYMATIPEGTRKEMDEYVGQAITEALKKAKAKVIDTSSD
ncbi:unnamed protein product [Anisakis simplex]|uniref:DUF148 domain-containing protein n=1 Tax=Anisakis simplex TaxID=6269 RepID=A0A0M3K769_ANISI|nr:unnamed protein product [Anisakis simplex]